MQTTEGETLTIVVECEAECNHQVGFKTLARNNPRRKLRFRPGLQPYGARSWMQRKPVWLVATVGAALSRVATRMPWSVLAALSHEPPRRTRSVPLVGPVGSLASPIS